MSHTVQGVKTKRDATRSLLRLGVAAGAAVVGAKSVSAAMARTWLNSRVLDAATDTLTKSVR